MSKREHIVEELSVTQGKKNWEAESHNVNFYFTCHNFTAGQMPLIKYKYVFTQLNHII